MSWKCTNPMEEKIRFIRLWKSGEFTVSQLCKDFQISRTTGHILIKRYMEEGEACFLDRHKAPRFIPHKTPDFIELAIIDLRRKHKNWGARKLKVLLQNQFVSFHIPSETTINAILKKNGLVKNRRKRAQRIKMLNPKFDPDLCNEIWSADYKGKFKLGNRKYCYPLTIADSKSRFLFTSKGHYNPTYKAVKREYKRVFKEYGMPQFLHTDNGVPFASISSVQRFSRLCYWLIDLGITPLFSDPGCPNQNGRHERMHRDLKADCAKPPAYNLQAQQKSMNHFVKQYNEIRPHEALDMRTPAQVHQPSKRRFPNKILPFDYDDHFLKLKVTKSGSIRWGAYHWVYIARGAIGRYVGLEEIGNGIWKVFYRNVFLGYFDQSRITRKEQHLKLVNQIV